MSLFKRDTALRTPETRKKKEREARIKLIFFFILLVIFTGGPIYLSRMDRFQIKHVQIVGTNVTKEFEVENVVVRNLEGNYYWVFPKGNALLYPRKKIESDLSTSIPRLTNVRVSRVSSEELKVEVKERTPFALYCNNLYTESVLDPNDCYFLDESGFIFSSAPSFSGDVYLSFAQGEPMENPLGRQFIETKRFKELSLLTEEVSNIGIYPRVFQIKSDEYHMYLPNGGDIMWKTSLDLNQMYTNLSSFLQDKAIAKESNFLDRILYIDMRFGNKIFYKVRE